jgi:putative ABC transport system ATP-binding protein
MSLAVRLENVHHEYGRTEESGSVTALEDISLEIAAGDFAILMGPSGSGKSTILNLIGAVDLPTRGQVFLGDAEISRMPERDLTLVRRTKLGFIFQFFNLIPTLTVRENIGFPLALGGERGGARERVAAVLEEIGLAHRASHYPNELSGGEMQRVAIGRAIVHDPPLILADEPTGNLDTRTGEKILELIRGIHDSRRSTVVMATHSDRAAAFGDYIIDVVDGTATRRGNP